ncbi:SWIM zinc finger family protein [Nocardia camponoti]|uniref:SWIM-type domain-containing protein n=1 Tax=Nocardia camponoti TaxID=1616106 RepID=A0A917QFN9_9NOCA|nr:DUF5691 domain-containing protein [Nocardia camponoti]GGK46644.1 hypothetical protein GCM10011591_17560 [Nocardia camponoti]
MTETPTVLTAEQVSALAPDASSLTAARKLASRWRETGATANAVWGLCQGSGSKPYQTIVDLAGPAYKCTCPSRKFPCKHALSLLLNWAANGVAAHTEPADFAAEWLAGRAAKAAAPKATSSKPISAEALEARGARVAAGLAELEIWLADQVRTGLAQADRSYATFEAIAARMVDAQAPGVAESLRKLPRAVTTTEHWPALLLREYARLHLLVRAYRGLATLPEPLQAGVRAHVGYPMRADTVLAEPAVRDVWQVLGMRVTEEDALHTRRTWLRGRSSGRWALFIEHSHGSPRFSSEVPAPGYEVDADLHFYPAPAPLRAQWGTRHHAPQPFATVPQPLSTALSGHSATDIARSNPPGIGAESSAPSTTCIEGALTAYAQALGADPWVRSWPALLVDVIPVPDPAGWWLIDTNRTALPVIAARQSLRLLAVSGGHPVTVMGEWTEAGFDPISVLEAGVVSEIEAVGTPELAVASPCPELAELVSVALMGTARRTIDGITLEPELIAALPNRTGEPATRLLEAASLYELYLSGGHTPAHAPVIPCAPAPSDPRPLLPTLAAARLSQLLSTKSPFLREWLSAASEFDYRLPDALCVQALVGAAADTSMRPQLLRLAGTRGRWLAPHNPGWSNLVDAFPLGAGSADQTPTAAFTTEQLVADEVWRYGTAGERTDWFANLRRTNPTVAVAVLADGWAKESGPIKAELLSLLADNLATTDEALLETALDDRRGDVRRAAVSLLTRLPHAAFGTRMIARVSAWLSLDEDGKVAVAVPETLDADARRDGLSDSTDQAHLRWETPDSTVKTLRQAVSSMPLTGWQTVTGQPNITADSVLSLDLPPRYAKAFVDGLVDATLAQRDHTWARAVFDHASPTEQAVLRRRELFSLLHADDRVEHVLDLDSHQLTELHAILPGLAHPWPARVADHILRLLGERARTTARANRDNVGVYSDRALLTAAGVHFPPDLAARVTTLADTTEDPAWQQAFHRLASDLRDRATMLEELR